jgi:hypothetical protein
VFTLIPGNSTSLEKILQAGGLLHHVRTREIVAALFQHLNHGDLFWTECCKPGAGLQASAYSAGAKRFVAGREVCLIIRVDDAVFRL